MAKLRLQDLSVKGKKVLMRVDFNVPQDDQGKITDDSRILAALPSIHYVLEHGGSLVLMSHLGRPNGQKNEKYSLAPVAKRLSELLKKHVLMAPDCTGIEVQRLAHGLKPQEILLLENLRFYEAEENPEKDPSFITQLASLGDLYVNDAFGTAHRAHASTALIAQEFPGKAAAGLLMQKEIKFLGDTLLNPKRPFYAIIGGAKISSKLGVLKSLLKKVDGLLIGGGMAYTFFKAQGLKIGKSICEDNLLNTAKEILEECSAKQIKLLLPVDLVVASEFKNDSPSQIIDIINGVPDSFEGMDIGPKTVESFNYFLKDAATILWNGPLGVAEMPNFAKGTQEIAKTLAHSQAVTIVGGGDSIAALQATGLSDQIDHVSTGGGASLEYLEYGKLPGVEALSDSIETVKTNLFS
ncbi:MAG: phosphoglycerate kinase [Parachlamydiales bacterium]|nr:phosphoglycerate kinase [Parachlamydiales bacterium]